MDSPFHFVSQQNNQRPHEASGEPSKATGKVAAATASPIRGIRVTRGDGQVAGIGMKSPLD
jgi:hypothetical protein